MSPRMRRHFSGSSVFSHSIGFRPSVCHRAKKCSVIATGSWNDKVNPRMVAELVLQASILEGYPHVISAEVPQASNLRLSDLGVEIDQGNPNALPRQP